MTHRPGSRAQLVLLAAAALGAGCQPPAAGELGDAVDIPAEVLQNSAGERRVASTSPTRVFLNFDGATIIHGTQSDATTNTSFIGTGGTIPPFDGTSAQRGEIIQRITAHFAAYNVTFVTKRPSSGDYTMLLVGGTPADIGYAASANTTGVAPMDCDNKLPRDIAFAFFDRVQDLVPLALEAYKTAEAGSHELGHTFGLPHTDDGCDLMSYSKCTGDKTFLDQTIPLQADTMGKCGLTAINTHQHLLATLGAAGTQPPPGDTTAPKVSFSSPLDQQQVQPDFTVQASITDDVGVVQARLTVDGSKSATRTSPPFSGTLFSINGLPNGAHTLKLEGFDAAGNVGSASISINVGPPTPPPVPDAAPPPPPDAGPPAVAPDAGATADSQSPPLPQADAAAPPQGDGGLAPPPAADSGQAGAAPGQGQALQGGCSLAGRPSGGAGLALLWLLALGLQIRRRAGRTMSGHGPHPPPGSPKSHGRAAGPAKVHRRPKVPPRYHS